MITQKDIEALITWKRELFLEIGRCSEAWGWDASLVIQKSVQLILLQKVIDALEEVKS